MYIKPITVKPDATLWLNTDDGRAIWPDGHAHSHTMPAPLHLSDLLALAKYTDATRVMLSGNQVERATFLQQVDGWTHGEHYLAYIHGTPTYRYTHVDGRTIEFRRTAEWFGEKNVNPWHAYQAWNLLDSVLKKSGKEPVALRRGPAATGKEMWIATLRGDLPDVLDDELQALIRSWAPQHRVQLLPPAQETMEGFHILDGRFMYAALTKELGTGPVTWLRAHDAEALATTQPYARARYYVKFKAPKNWGNISIFPTKNSDGKKWDWDKKNGETWVDSAELRLAILCGYEIEFIEAIQFTKARPLDKWTNRLLRARDLAGAADAPEPVRDMASSALRTILLYGIGSFHSVGNTQTTLTASPMQRPAGDGWDVPDMLDDGQAIWTRQTPQTNARAKATQHPEFSAQVWGRAHAHILDGPAGNGNVGGLLNTPESTIVAIYGDALMTTVKPWWADSDDGKVGRLRMKGTIAAPRPWPTTESQRAALVKEASNG
jgi:hypothetical protein